MGNEIAKRSPHEGSSRNTLENVNDRSIDEIKSFTDILLGSGGDILSPCSSSDRYDPVSELDTSAEVEVVAARSTDDIYLLSSVVASQSDNLDDLSDHLSRTFEQLADPYGLEFILERHSSSSPEFFDAEESHEIDDYIVHGDEYQELLTADELHLEETSNLSDQNSSCQSLSDNEHEPKAFSKYENRENGVPTLTPEKAMSLLDDSLGIGCADNSSVAFDTSSIHHSGPKQSTPIREPSSNVQNRQEQLCLVESLTNTTEVYSTSHEIKTQLSEELMPCYLNCCNKLFTRNSDQVSSTDDLGVLSSTQDETHEETFETSLEITQLPRDADDDAPYSSSKSTYNCTEATNINNYVMRISSNEGDPVSTAERSAPTLDDITNSSTTIESDSCDVVSTTDGLSCEVEQIETAPSHSRAIIATGSGEASCSSDILQVSQAFITDVGNSQITNTTVALIDDRQTDTCETEPIASKEAYKLVPRKDFLIQPDVLDHHLFVPISETIPVLNSKTRSMQKSFMVLDNHMEDRSEPHINRPSIDMLEADLNLVRDLLQLSDMHPHQLSKSSDDIFVEKPTNISSQTQKYATCLIRSKKRMRAIDYLESSFGRPGDFTLQEQALALIKWHQLLSQSKHFHVSRLMNLGIGFRHFYYSHFVLKGEDINGRFFSRLMGLDELVDSGFKEEEDETGFLLQRPLYIDFPSSDDGRNITNDDRNIIRNKVILDNDRDTESLLTTLLTTAQREMNFLTNLMEEMVNFCSSKDSTHTSTEFSINIKKREDVLNKADRKYQGDILQVKDILRASIIFHDESSLFQSLIFLFQYSQLHPDIYIIRIKNLFWSLYEGCIIRTNLPTGYRHILVNIRLKSGLLLEIQLQIQGIFEVLGIQGYKLHKLISEYGLTKGE